MVIKKNSGLTLVELIISVTILSIVSLILAGYLDAVIKFFRLQQVKFELDNSMRTAVNFIQKKLRTARVTTITIHRHSANEPPYSKLSTDTFSIYQQGKALYYATPTTTPKKIAENLSHIHFYYPISFQNDIISVTLCFEKSAPKKIFHMGIHKMKVMN